jgi:hypothetical protein
MHLARVPGMGDLSEGDAHAFEKSLHRCPPRAAQARPAPSGIRHRLSSCKSSLI